ncbi:hypothetical protein [Aeromonas veronii]|uniref:Uncharacterized protein n=1 Tax=Aeromonas veronii TaxID=654 RepID=A0A4S5CK86_AERVE|nr:hypothetical protein [Aeromonas veronii]THJ45071.1 hypothetical protein E8Q35_12885 [Aeromonas veronii]
MLTLTKKKPIMAIILAMFVIILPVYYILPGIWMHSLWLYYDQVIALGMQNIWLYSDLTIALVFFGIPAAMGLLMCVPAGLKRPEKELLIRWAYWFVSSVCVFLMIKIMQDDSARNVLIVGFAMKVMEANKPEFTSLTSSFIRDLFGNVSYTLVHMSIILLAANIGFGFMFIRKFIRIANAKSKEVCQQ